MLTRRLCFLQSLERKYGADSVQARAASSILTTTISFVRRTRAFVSHC
jgi:hypothetical protein